MPFMSVEVSKDLVDDPLHAYESNMSKDVCLLVKQNKDVLDTVPVDGNLHEPIDYSLKRSNTKKTSPLLDQQSDIRNEPEKLKFKVGEIVTLIDNELGKFVEIVEFTRSFDDRILHKVKVMNSNDTHIVTEYVLEHIIPIANIPLDEENLDYHSIRESLTDEELKRLWESFQMMSPTTKGYACTIMTDFIILYMPVFRGWQRED